MNTNGLEEIIEDSLTDAITEPISDDVASVDTGVTPDPEVAPEGQPEPQDATDSTEVGSPASKPAEAAPVDEFDKRFGLPGQQPGGRENRIPYTRVKAMVKKAEEDSKANALKEFQPRLTEFEAKVKDYEGRLTQVAQFEQIMTQDPDRFLGMLSQLPAYKNFFDTVAALAQGGQPQQAQAQTQAPQ
jgi:hypothetical protein